MSVEEGIECGGAVRGCRTRKSQPTNPVFFIPVKLRSPPLSHHSENHLPPLFPPVTVGITAPDLCRKKRMYLNFEHQFSTGGMILFNLHHNFIYQMRKLRPGEVMWYQYQTVRVQGATSDLRDHVPFITFHCFPSFCP